LHLLGRVDREEALDGQAGAGGLGEAVGGEVAFDPTTQCERVDRRLAVEGGRRAAEEAREEKRRAQQP
tara:strand:+ start:220 stop:423 length:204 start_codon:yes stop_codon:yes gene_type:complete